MPAPDAISLGDLISYLDTPARAWKPLEEGARYQTLHVDKDTGLRVVLVQWDPGYTLSYRDEHPHHELLYICSGTFIDQNRMCGPGTFIHNEPGSWHQPTTPDGCTYLAIISGG